MLLRCFAAVCLSVTTLAVAADEALILRPAYSLSDDDRAELAARGVFIRQPLPGGRYLVTAAEGAALTDPLITSLDRVTPEMKLARSVREEIGHGKTWADLHVIFHREVSFDDAREAMLRVGAQLEHPFAVAFSPSWRLQIRIAPSSLSEVAADHRVVAITGLQTLEAEEHNVVSAALSSVPELHAAPFGLSGEGVVVSVSELSRADTQHPEFGSRLTLNTVPIESAFANHPTHVSGTVGALGVRPEAKGMAPAAKIVQHCSTCGYDNGVWLDLKDDELHKARVIADNNSWGFIIGWRTVDDTPTFLFRDYYYGAYDLLLAAPLDDISATRNVLFIFSAGNDGNPPAGVRPSNTTWSKHFHADATGEAITGEVFCYSENGGGTDCPSSPCEVCETIRHHATPNYPFDTMSVTASAKNVVAVGALTDTSEIASFSSRGPAKDGRVKPDLVARGVGVLSPTAGNQYDRFNGTSMAAPVVTGIAALLTEQWRKTFHGADPRPEQLKALLIHGATDLGHPGPDYTYGFGRVDAKRSAEVIVADGGEGRRLRTLSVAQERTHEFELVLSEPRKLRLVLNWADPYIIYLPMLGQITDTALVNDLDLSVVDPTGTVIRPFVLDKSQPAAEATTGVNTVDNVELLEIANAVPGTYRVRVTGSNIRQGPQAAILTSSADLVPHCFDASESSEVNVAEGEEVRAAICARDDVDHFRFLPGATGPLRVRIVSGDTPLRAALTANGLTDVHEIAANSRRTIEVDVRAVPGSVLLSIEAAGPIGTAPQYRVQIGEPDPKRRRSARH